MKTRPVPLFAIALSFLLVILGGCRRTHEGWEPPVEETSTRLLKQEADEALRFVDAARADLAGSQGPAAEHMSSAVQALQRLTLYYLPLLEARERIYNAHRFLYYGEMGRAERELDAAERILDHVVEIGGHRLFTALAPSLDLVGEAKAAIRGAPDEAPRLLKDLAVKLNLATLKGELELSGGWPPQDPAIGGP
jgi:hypothetical protein